VRLGFESDNRIPIHRREVWERICLAAGGDGHASGGDGVAKPASARETVLEAVGR
jgi:sRNA-binding carbon storage regulator CsrA